MGSNRRAIVLLGILAVLLAILAWRQFSRVSPAAADVPQPATQATPPSPPPPGAQAGPGPARAGAGGGRAAAGRVPEVELDKLQVARAEPAPATRNLFRFQPKAPPPPPPGARAAMSAAQVPAAPAGPPPPPPPPPIPLRLIGIIDGARGGKIAVLTDSANRGDTFYGQEGDVIDGRYRILKIGIESVDMEYVDGRGRQPIRLSGQ